jgi:hypothetical protein
LRLAPPSSPHSAQQLVVIIEDELTNATTTTLALYTLLAQRFVPAEKSGVMRCL